MEAESRISKQSVEQDSLWDLVLLQIAVYSFSCVSDVLKVLNDLDETSKRRVDILDHFVVSPSRVLSS